MSIQKMPGEGGGGGGGGGGGEKGHIYTLPEGQACSIEILECWRGRKRLCWSIYVYGECGGVC